MLCSVSVSGVLILVWALISHTSPFLLCLFCFVCLFFSYGFFFLLFVVFYHHLSVLPFLEKIKIRAMVLQKLHVVCRRLFPQAHSYCGRRDDNLLKKPRREKEAQSLSLRAVKSPSDSKLTLGAGRPRTLSWDGCPWGKQPWCPRGASMPTGTPQDTSKAGGNVLMSAASRLLINIYIPLLYPCLKYTWFSVSLGREGIVLGMYIKVLASEKKKIWL